MNPISRKTCSALLIGNELLNGKTKDLNGHLLGQLCSNIGIRLREIRVIPDHTPTIVENVLELKERSNFVFTSGGVGPTHDDITYESIAAAFKVPCDYHQPTLKRMRNYYESKGVPMTEARKRMALFPAGAKVFFCSKAAEAESEQEEFNNLSVLKPLIPFSINSEEVPRNSVWTPLVMKENVGILPGIPSLYAHIMRVYFSHYLHPYLSWNENHQKPMYRIMFGTNMAEGDLADHLRFVQTQFEGKVGIGSYPRWSLVSPPTNSSNNDTSSIATNVILSFEGDHQHDVECCVEMVRQKIPLHSLERK